MERILSLESRTATVRGGQMTIGRRIKVSLVILDLVINAVGYRLLMNSTQIIVAKVSEQTLSRIPPKPSRIQEW